MKKKATASVLAAVLAISVIPVTAPAKEVSAENTEQREYGVPGEDYVDGQVIVRLREEPEAMKREKRSGSVLDQYETDPSLIWKTSQLLVRHQRQLGKEPDWHISR